MSTIRDIQEAFREAIDGNADPIQVSAAIRSVIDEATSMINELKPLVEAELRKYPKQTTSAGGYTVSYKSGGAMYKFDHIPEWAQLNERRKEIEERAKLAVNQHEKGVLVATSDGEEIPMAIKTHKADSINYEKAKNS